MTLGENIQPVTLLTASFQSDENVQKLEYNDGCTTL